MFKIAICDDEAMFLHELKSNLEKHAAETDNEFCFLFITIAANFVRAIS